MTDHDSDEKTPAPEAASDARLVAAIERTLPAIDPAGASGGGEGGGTAPAESLPKRNGRPPGRKDSAPRKTAKRTGAFVFAPPDEGPENPYGTALPVSFQPESAPEPRDPQDWIDYGVALGGIHAGYYEAKHESVLADAAKKLAPDTVEGFRTRLMVSDRTRGNLEKGYAALAEKINAPKGGAAALGWLHAARSLHVQQMAAINEIREFLRTLSDLKPEPSA